ncbi:MAG: bifunctional (p)ppGpp synthetase/guanosine-3',5'-bis(diphosphate) 3'-pyrophosphohydrolase [Magnetococcales bacterium]|nr:bifunctional (p)ppGpp synthetase/guanosine-3',5'-bis(diphosphate) 3'-pyrophosphohydrolase [Magnetococcales bacterium]
MEALLRALHVAAEKHRLQKRKDGITPYINHPIAVAEVLCRVGGVSDTALLQAALLHDTVEDTQTTPDELKHHFGSEVAALVGEVTDDKTLPKAERKRLQIESAAKKSTRAKVLKLADLCCNLADLLENPPPDWPRERRQAYVTWCRQVAAGLRGSNPPLEAHLDRLIRRGECFDTDTSSRLFAENT